MDVLQPHEYSKLLANVPDAHKLMVRFLFESGARIGEVRGLRFDDIDWRDVRDTGDRTSAQRYDEETGPFTRDEARELSRVWSKIREANSFADINWKAVGLSRAGPFLPTAWSSAIAAHDVIFF